MKNIIIKGWKQFMEMMLGDLFFAVGLSAFVILLARFFSVVSACDDDVNRSVSVSVISLGDGEKYPRFKTQLIKLADYDDERDEAKLDDGMFFRHKVFDESPVRPIHGDVASGDNEVRVFEVGVSEESVFSGVEFMEENRDDESNKNEDNVVELKEVMVLDSEDWERSEGEGVECNDDDERWVDDWEGVERTELEKRFGDAVVFVGSKSNADRILSLSHSVKIRLHGLHKVAIEGPCRGHQPMALKVSARAKWNAWHLLGDMSREVAMEQYIALLSKSIPGWSGENAKDQE